MEHRRRSRLPAILRAGPAVLVLVAVGAAAQRVALAQSSHYTFTQVATLGGNTPFVSYFEPAAINDLGEVLFAPDLTTGGEGVFFWRAGRLTPIATGGEQMPDGGVFGYTMSPLAMNLLCDVAFIMTRNGTNPNDQPFPSGLNAGVYRYNSRTGVVPVMVPGLKGHGGGAFFGSSFIAAIDNRADIVFPGMICSTVQTSVPTVPCPDGSPGGLALGVYRARAHGGISAVVKPGDPAPGGAGKSFDLAHGPSINDLGDIAFGAHVYGEPCANAGTLFCADSLYVKRSGGRGIESIAHHGDPSPVPGKNYYSAFGPVLNCVGDVAFLGDLSDQGDGSEVAVFLHAGRKTIAIAKSGDAMPGGGTLAAAGFYPHDAYMNNSGDIAFVGTLTNGDNGLYVWRRGTLRLVAKTGTNTGVGTISTLDDFGGGQGNTQIAINDAGRILFAARFQEGGGALLVATPK